MAILAATDVTFVITIAIAIIGAGGCGLYRRRRGKYRQAQDNPEINFANNVFNVFCSPSDRD